MLRARCSRRLTQVEQAEPARGEAELGEAPKEHEHFGAGRGGGGGERHDAMGVARRVRLHRGLGEQGGERLRPGARREVEDVQVTDHAQLAQPAWLGAGVGLE